MNLKNVSFVLKWVGVVIVIAGAIEMTLNYLEVIVLPIRFDAFMLLILGVALFCFLPSKYLKYKEIEQKNGQPNVAGKRSFAVNVIVSAVLTGYGILKLLDSVQ